MEEGNLTLLIVGVIGFIQVAFAATLAYLNNRSSANKDDESVYAGLVDRLETHLKSSDERIKILEGERAKYKLLWEECEDNE